VVEDSTVVVTIELAETDNIREPTVCGIPTGGYESRRCRSHSHLPHVALGVAPFLVGDVLKALLAGAMPPATWRYVGDGEGK